MCGVFGFVGTTRPNLARLRDIAINTMTRGDHAFGFAWIDGRGRLKMYKQHGRIADHLDTLELVADARMIIGHCRWATHGKPANNINNHPHPSDGGWIVHNGMIPGHARIGARNGFFPVSECDTEVLAQLVEDGEGTLSERCRNAVEEVSGTPLVMMGLWARPGRLVIARAGNPLSMGTCVKGNRYFASYAEELPGRVEEVTNGSLIEFGAAKVKRSRLNFMPAVANSCRSRLY